MPMDIAASVRARLLTLSRKRGDDFQFVLDQYVMQRLLYRLSRSDYADQFLLKGALLFWVWTEDFHRPTRDIDLLSYGANDVPHLVDTFQRIVALEECDGLVFNAASITGKEIKADADYPGVRLNGRAYLGKAHSTLQIDIGFGDAVVPTAEYAQLPGFLDFPFPQLRIYPVYVVIAEKFQAMVHLGLANSRMKDFFDIRVIAKTMDLDGDLLRQAIAATFERRKTPITNEALTVFTSAFSGDAGKRTQWLAFLRKNEIETPQEFGDVVGELAQLLSPVYDAIATDQPFKSSWLAEAFIWEVP